MLHGDRFVQLIATSALLVCLILSATLSTRITAAAGRAQLTYTDQASEGDPPEIAIGVAMGAFRGLFVNWLWIRASRLKQEGKFFEAIQLAEAITRLQPRFPRVWGFHAWNMAYNISVATHTAEERWQWVKAGYELLRDEAIPRNPNDVLLHKELAWIFVHKIQGFADDANHFYKQELAKEWTIVLGPPPRLDGTREENMHTMAGWLQPIVSAPDSLQEVIDDEIQFQKDSGLGLNEDGQPVSRVAELVDRIKTEAGIPIGKELLRFVAYRLAATLDAWYLEETGGDLTGAYHNSVIDKLMSDERYGHYSTEEGRQYSGPWLRLLAYVRRRVIIDEKHMEPQRMQRYTLKYGPLDWRHPAAHALYWSARGVDEGLERSATTKYASLNTDRITIHAIQEMFRFGEIQYDLLTGEYFVSNNFDWADAYGDVLAEVMNKERGGIVSDTEKRGYTLYGSGYENFLRDVIRVAYNRGEMATAEKYHTILRNWRGLNLNDPDLPYDLTLPLEDFVRLGMQERLGTPQVAVSEAESALMDAFIRGLGLGMPEVFKRKVEYAEKVRDGFFKIQDITTLVDPEHIRMREYMESTFAEFVAKIFIRVCRGTGNAQYRIGPYKAAQIYRRAPLGLQRIAYDDLIREVKKANQGIDDITLRFLFPEPPGHAEFMAELDKLDDDAKARRRAIEWTKQ